jgi:chemotaxis protein CheD
MSDCEKIRVGIADSVVASSPSIITTYGLGSCVAVMLYDPVARVGGMNHFLLPVKKKRSAENKVEKYSKSGIEDLIRKVIDLGGKKERLVAKVVGGANMFPTLAQNSIGKKNTESAIKVLKSHSIDIVGRDTGGTWGRSIDFYLSTGKTVVRSNRKGNKEI